jgi:hypothetical protein
VLRNQGVGAPASAVIIYRCSDYTKSKSIISNMKAFKDKGYNISNLLNKTNILNKKYT